MSNTVDPNDDPGWKWTGSKEITLASVMVVLIIIVSILALWNYVTSKRRREEAAVRREVLLIARHAQAREERKKRKTAIDKALIHSVSVIRFRLLQLGFALLLHNANALIVLSVPLDGIRM